MGVAFPFYVNSSETLATLAPQVPLLLDRLFRRRSFEVIHVHNPFGVAIRCRRSCARSARHGCFHPQRRPERLLASACVLPPASHPPRARRRAHRRLAGSRPLFPAVLPSIEYEVIPNGVNTEVFTPAAEPLAHLKGKRNILFVGRFDPRTPQAHARRLLRAPAASLRRPAHRRRRRPAAQTPATQGSEGNDRDVSFEGRVNGLRPRYLASAEILCTPCGLASFGMVVLEAIARGHQSLQLAYPVSPRYSTTVFTD